MSEPGAADLLRHLRDAARQIAEFIDGMAESDFLADKRTQQAVVLNLIILGEAATKLMDRHPDQAAIYPGIEWRSMRGMRNRIAHGYYDIDMAIVWRTVNEAVPALADALGSLVAPPSNAPPPGSR